MLRLAVIIGILVAYALFTRKLEARVSGPMVFMTIGILIAEPFLGWFSIADESPVVDILLKGALALVLFIEASHLGRRGVRRASLPSRLLLVGMPLVMIGGLVVAGLLFGVLSFWEAAVVGALLAPTDAALGLPVFENKRVPERIRDALLIEGGLNDGIAVPFALFAAGAGEVSAGIRDGSALIELLLEQIGVAVVIGIVVGWVAGKVYSEAHARQWATDGWLRLALIGIAVIMFALAEGFHGSGFISVWVGGLVFGLVAGPDLVGHRDFSENGSKLLVLLSFLVFGALAIGPLLPDLSWQLVLYAVVALFVVRPVAVGMSMIGSGEQVRSVAFMGWFGPRGLPSLVLALILISKDFALASGDVILDIVTVTVAVSVYVYGVTAQPLANSYADWAQEASTPP